MASADSAVAGFVESLLGGIVEEVSAEARAEAMIADYNARMKQRDERRLREGWTPEQVKRGSRAVRTRPSDGQPSGAPFDYDEYLTRKEDRKAADPESYQRERAAKREANRRWWFNYKETSDFDRCNAALLDGRDPSYNRLLDIWTTIQLIEQSQKLDSIHLDQRARIANIKNRERCEGRTRGIRAAVKRAGY